MRLPALLGKAVQRTRSRGRVPLQVGALPYRRREDGSIEVMLVTTRSSGRWIIPKGWPIAGKTPAEAAEQEAYEEAGVRGYTSGVEIGRFSHEKGQFLSSMRTQVAVFPLSVQEELPAWPERGERTRCWFSVTEAARLVQSDDLGLIIANLGGNRLLED